MSTDLQVAPALAAVHEVAAGRRAAMHGRLDHFLTDQTLLLGLPDAVEPLVEGSATHFRLREKRIM